MTCSRVNCIKDLRVLIDSKLYLHHHMDYRFSQTDRLLGLIWTVTFSFASLHSFLMYCILGLIYNMPLLF